MSSLSAPLAGDVARSLPPLSYRLPEWEPSARPAKTSSLRFPTGLGMFALAVWLAVEDNTFRHFEAWLATPITGFVTGRHGATTSHDLVYFALGTPRAFGLQVTQECTSALLLIPLLVMMGSFTIFSRLSLLREVVAVAVGGLLLLVVNIARVAGIAWSTWHFGYSPGYTFSHVFVGSAMSLIGFVGALLLALWVLVRGSRPTSHAANASGGAQTPSANDSGSRALWAALTTHAWLGRSRGRSGAEDRDATVAGCEAALASLTQRIDDFEALLNRSSR